jgi:hypothetical protein
MDVKSALRACEQMVPPQARELLRGSVVHRAYLSLLSSELVGRTSLQQADLRETRFETPTGEMSLLAPAGNPLFTQSDVNQVEPRLSEEVCDHLTTDTVFYDIGAHYGYYTKLAYRVGVPGHLIHAFEPDFFNYSILERNAPFCEHKVKKSVVETSRSDGIALDDYITEHTPPDLMKIDIQGAELNALRGATTLLQKYEPIVFVEVHPTMMPLFGATAEEVYGLLAQRGYEVMVGGHRDDHDQWVPASRESISRMSEKHNETAFIMFAVC